MTLQTPQKLSGIAQLKKFISLLGSPSQLKQVITQRYQNYQAPFSERRALLVTVDAFLVLLGTWGAFLIWVAVNGQANTIVFIQERWYWFPIFLGSYWTLAALTW